ncbi:hypothetical protein Cme02nite_63670 [Catellatospora methionotrophica]|uniref:Uncharacterized protein n=1 Tax=Catellatospora methionotrophica TaxID=121620 RepID=A0A8J3LGS6_9ACTN|nr:hypothetical protein [Catellatospora methionotrophica]GIG18035.1 hypothetical protein Cme02nite_63670 [Catellatospora methionotrophica]
MQAEQLADFTWAFDVVHPDAERRRAAIERERGYQDDWARLHSWSRIVRPRTGDADSLDPRLVAEHDQTEAAKRDVHDRMFAAPIWHYLSAPTPGERTPFARFAVLYLRWETEYPQEWAEHARSWQAKRHILRTLAADGPTLDTHAELLGLLAAAIGREHRCEDLGYLKIARTLHEPMVRMIIESAERSLDGLVRLRAGYLRWALDNPTAPVTPASWRRWLRR